MTKGRHLPHLVAPARGSDGEQLELLPAGPRASRPVYPEPGQADLFEVSLRDPFGVLDDQDQGAPEAPATAGPAETQPGPSNLEDDT